MHSACCGGGGSADSAHGSSGSSHGGEDGSHAKGGGKELGGGKGSSSGADSVVRRPVKEQLVLHEEMAELDAQLDAAAAAGAKFIIPGVSGRFAHSQLHAIMGPSGCGKTSLCKALARRLPPSRVLGDIRVLCSSAADGYKSESALSVCGHKRRVAPGKCYLAHMTGYVPQFDLLHESLTVLENLEIACRLRLPFSSAWAAADQPGCSDVLGARRRQRRLRCAQVSGVVLEVMALMALNKVAHQVVGGSASRRISGGQRKRVAVGVELVAKPALLWLDEPTSGLDAAVALDVVGALKSSSERGMNVLAVMHQPRCSIFNMFDTCLLLSSNGHVVFAGPQRMALAYAAFLSFYIPPGENVADFLMDVIAGGPVAHAMQLFSAIIIFDGTCRLLAAVLSRLS
eukprot:GHRQ01007167.1.p1 GENE.GHRQ01007167.1~~GHRQ01007167.1.p1  ORF type:complete len:454 (+),score=193.21 GHRQ01007167.1:164-1363(+)